MLRWGSPEPNGQESNSPIYSANGVYMLHNINSVVTALTPYFPGKPAEEFVREVGIPNPVRLASNENPRGAGEKVQAAIRKTLAELSRYPDATGYRLRSALAERLGVEIERVTLGNGSSEVLDLAARAILEPRASAIVDQYCFVVYPLAVAAAHGELIRVPSRDWEHDLDGMLNHVNENTRMIFIANPNNPTGTWVNEITLRAFLDALPSTVWVVLDEAYFEYAAAFQGFPDGVTLSHEYPNLIVTRTFSKVYGMAALRVGYSISSPEFSELLNRIRPPFNVSSIALAAAEVALKDDEFVEESRLLNGNGMKVVRSGLESLGFSVLNSAGNFLTFDCGYPAEPLYEELLRVGVIVRPVANYRLPNCLRVTIGTAEENDRFLSALKGILDGQVGASLFT